MKKFTISILSIIFILSSQTSFAQRSSLYELDDSPFSSRIARKPGDTLLVIINENASTKDLGQNAVEKKYQNFEFILQKFFFPYFKMNKGFDDSEGTGDKPGFKFNIDKKYDGKVTRGSQMSFSTNIQVRIVEHINKNQYLIKGHKFLTLNGKETKLHISGIIREEDIDEYNRISSSLIADAVIKIDGETANDDLKPGLLEHIFGIFF